MSTLALAPFYGVRLDAFLTRHRIGLWRAVTAGVLLALAFGETHAEDAWLAGAMVCAGVAAVSLATVGRLWCALYISGRKSVALVDQGPYSVCRHPLYVCNFVGVAGLGLLTESVVLAGSLVAAFALIYPAVIRSEDRGLAAGFPEHAEYLSRTPAFWPRVRLYRSERTWVVHVGAYLRNVADSVWFLLGAAVIEAMDRMHELQWLPSGFALV